MLEPMVLRKEQEATVKEILSSKMHLCRGEGGSGKTVIGVEAVLRSHAKITIIVCPLNTFKGWKTTFMRQSRGKVEPRVIDSKKAGKLNFEALASREPGVYILNWERFRMFDWSAMPLDFVILDEAHRTANRRSTTYNSVLTTRHADYLVALSATPWGNKLEGAWALLNWMWFGNKEVAPAYWPWITRMFHTELDQYQGKKIVGERVQGSVWESVPSRSYFKAPYQKEPIIHEIECEMAPYQRKVYDRFEKEAIVWLKDRPLVADLPQIMRLRLREIALAVPSIKEGWVRKQDAETGEWEKVWGEIVYFEEDAKSAKVDSVIEVLNDLYAEKPEPVLIFTHSRKFTDLLTKRLQAKGFRATQFVGGMTAEDRQWKMDNFGKEFDIMVATIATIGEGSDGLQLVCAVEFWMSLEDNRLLNTQAKWRLSRDGQTRPVQRYLFLAPNTIETVQLGKLEADQAQLDRSFDATEDQDSRAAA